MMFAITMNIISILISMRGSIFVLQSYMNENLKTI